MEYILDLRTEMLSDVMQSLAIISDRGSGAYALASTKLHPKSGKETAGDAGDSCRFMERQNV